MQKCAFGKNQDSVTPLTDMTEAMPKPNPLLGEAEEADNGILFTFEKE